MFNDSEQEHCIVVSRLLREHFVVHPDGSLNFWDYPSSVK